MLDLSPRPFHRGSIHVPALGLGAGGLGDDSVDDRGVDALISKALELGVTLIDTAPSYGASEERLGRVLFGRRHQFVLSTKVGYAVPNVPDWTADAVRLGIDRALGVLRTDHLDIVHLHSCPHDVLERGDVARALFDAVDAGKVRVAAYSGDGHALYVAVEMGFGGIQASLSLVDRNNAPTLRMARERGIGVVAKRALCNAPWRYLQSPAREDEARAWSRWLGLAYDFGDHDPASIAIRWVVFHTDTDCALVGTRSDARLEQAVRAVNQGPLSDGLIEQANQRWEAVGASWPPLT